MRFAERKLIRAGHKVTKVGDEIDEELAAVPGSYCANESRVNFHARVCNSDKSTRSDD
jgi:hypothetical protein